MLIRENNQQLEIKIGIFVMSGTSDLIDVALPRKLCPNKGTNSAIT